MAILLHRRDQCHGHFPAPPARVPVRPHSACSGRPPAPETIRPSLWFLRMPRLQGPPMALGLTQKVVLVRGARHGSPVHIPIVSKARFPTLLQPETPAGNYCPRTVLASNPSTFSRDRTSVWRPIHARRRRFGSDQKLLRLTFRITGARGYPKSGLVSSRPRNQQLARRWLNLATETTLELFHKVGIPTLHLANPLPVNPVAAQA